MCSAVLVKRLVLGLLLLLLASFVASEVFAWQHGWHKNLGRPLTSLQRVPLYSPDSIWLWAYQWGYATPRHFQGAAIAALVTLGLVAYPFRKKTEASDVARWANSDEVREGGLYAPHGTVLGKYKGRILRHGGTTHTLVVAPTDAGKTTSTAVPTVLDTEPGPEEDTLILHDPKNELYDLTAGYRATFTTVIHLDPTSPISDRYNPLAAVRWGTEHEIRDMSMIATIMANPDSDPQDDTGQHFGELVTDLNIGVGLHGLYTGQAKTMRELDDFYMSEDNLMHLFRQMAKTHHTSAGCHPAVRRAMRIMSRLKGDELSGVLSTASRALRMYLDPLVARMTSASDFTLMDVRERSKPMTLYLTVPYSEQERLRPLSRLILRQILGYCTQRLDGWQHPVRAIIDEVQALRRFMAISEALNYARGYGFTFVLITPSLHELDRQYGPNNNFLESCQVRVAYAPNDFRIADRFSHQTGQTEAEKTRQTFAQDVRTMVGRRSTSTETVEKPLLSPTGLMYGLKREQVLLLVGNMFPLIVTKARYWKHRLWRTRSQILAPGKDRHAA